MEERRPRRHRWGGCRWRRGLRFEARDCDGRTAFQRKRSGSLGRGCLNLKAGLGFITPRRKDAEDAEGERNRGGGWVHPMGERLGKRVCSLPLRSLRSLRFKSQRQLPQAGRPRSPQPGRLCSAAVMRFSTGCSSSSFPLTGRKRKRKRKIKRKRNKETLSKRKRHPRSCKSRVAEGAVFGG